MKIFQLPVSRFARELRSEGVWLHTGPFQTHLRTSIEFLARAIHLLYGDFTLVENPQFADFRVRVETPKTFRRWYRPYAFFSLDDETPFRPLPLSEAPALLEWCLNWCIESRAHQYLMIHAAVVERFGSALILPAPPASGKSTLTAALISRGWRLLSDELTLIDPIHGFITPIARPIGLKNESIEVIRKFVPNAVMGPTAVDRVKGTIAYLKPPSDSVDRIGDLALPQWVIFPKFQAGAPVAFTNFPKPNALLRLADSSFNYSQHGVQGFETVVTLIDRCRCYELTYGRLDDAVAQLDMLVPDQQVQRV